MKKLLFLLLPALLMACGSGVEQYRASIETLDAEWQSATASVTELSSNINNELSEFSKAMGELRIADDVMAKLKPEQVTEWQTAQQNLTQSLQAYVPIRTEIGEFTKAWGMESAKVQSLKDALAAGKIEGDVAAQIDSLNTLIAQAKESVGKWQTAYADAKKNADASLEALRTTHSTLMASVPAM